MGFSQKAPDRAAFFMEMVETGFFYSCAGRVWMLKSLLLLVFVASSGVAYAAMPEPDVQVVSEGVQVVINLPQTRLFVYRNGQLVKSFPVAVGKMLTKTPTGSFEVTGIYHDPSWHVPKSIQNEMRAQGKPVQTVVPPGENNPLGKVFIRFGEPGLGLGMHGTNAPGSVPGFRSHGCVRLKNPDALELASLVKMGAVVTVAYQTILLNLDESGQLWLTAYRNLYQNDGVSMRLLAKVLLDWQRQHSQAVYGSRVDQALAVRDGKPVCLTCRSPGMTAERRPLLALRWLSAPPDGSAHVATRPEASKPGSAEPQGDEPDDPVPASSPAVQKKEQNSKSVELHRAASPI
jgi:hypothetical protein